MKLVAVFIVFNPQCNGDHFGVGCLITIHHHKASVGIRTRVDWLKVSVVNTEPLHEFRCTSLTLLRLFNFDQR